MNQIVLTSGNAAIVDQADHERLSQWSWKESNKGYAYRSARNGKGWKNLYMHHLVLPATEESEVDHINRNRLDNRRENLRLVPHWVNAHNRQTRPNSCGSRGITKPKGRNRWIARIYLKKKMISLGSFATQQEAQSAYAEAQKKYGLTV